MGYAYADKYGLLHVVDKQDIAELAAKAGTKVVETDIDSEAGFPRVGGEKVFVYLDTKEAYIGGNINSDEAKPYKYWDNPVLMDIINGLEY